MYNIKILPDNRVFSAPEGVNLLDFLREQNIYLDAPCGGHGKCGKCLVRIDGTWVKACSVTVRSDLTVTVKHENALNILKNEEKSVHSADGPVFAAFDIGTTSLVCNLLDAAGNVIATEGAANPQTSFGAEVVTRIRAALTGYQDALTAQIRNAMSLLLASACCKAGIRPDSIVRVAVVGNPAMQQLFLGISTRNLVEIPFSPVLTKSEILSCAQILPVCRNSDLLTVPDISGYVGADTIGCILSTAMYRREEITLLVDIGTNGEMVLGNQYRMVACATAAGPALEGANIRFGMRACTGAIDHLWLEDREIRFSTIGDAPAIGICGSGLIDAVAVFLELGKINSRGRIVPEYEMDGQRILPITEEIYLTQEDIRQVQLAKGAIQAGIRLMVRELGISLDEIDRCLLAGAFGSFLSPESACRIGLLPDQLLPKIRSVGNAAAEGANRIAVDPGLLRLADTIAKSIEYLELSTLGEFPKTFAQAMRF